MRVSLLLLSLVLSAVAYAQVDDIYFVPKKEKKVAVERTNDIYDDYDTGVGIANTIDDDVYNRRVNVLEESVDDEEYEESDLFADEDEYEYSSRIVRFHSPHRVIVSSPWYWDVVYTSGSNNWVIYDDGIYWDLYPSYYSSWYYPHWSWSMSWCGGYYGWHFGYNNWWHHHHHYYPHGGWYHNGHFAGVGHGIRDNRVPPIMDMRTGHLSQRGNTDGRGNNRIANTNGNTQRRPTGVNGANGNGQRRPTGVSGANSSGQRRPTGVSGANGNGQRRPASTDKGGSNQRRPSSVNSKKERENKTYDRPSSTRNTDVDRSSTRRSSSSSFGGSSRGSMGGVSRGGGSRGGRR